MAGRLGIVELVAGQIDSSLGRGKLGLGGRVGLFPLKCLQPRDDPTETFPPIVVFDP
jgi:hypothetical protein